MILPVWPRPGHTPGGAISRQNTLPKRIFMMNRVQSSQIIHKFRGKNYRHRGKIMRDMVVMHIWIIENNCIYLHHNN